VEPEIIERFVTLWENRVEAATAGGASDEMMAFSWWFFTKYFDDEWSLGNLHAALKLTGGQLDMIMTSLDRLSELAGKYPGLAIDCMQLIAAASPEYIELWTLDVITVIKAGLLSGDKLTREKSRHLIEELGTKGIGSSESCWTLAWIHQAVERQDNPAFDEVTANEAPGPRGRETASADGRLHQASQRRQRPSISIRAPFRLSHDNESFRRRGGFQPD
jgi:hypothetical protein